MFDILIKKGAVLLIPRQIPSKVDGGVADWAGGHPKSAYNNYLIFLFDYQVRIFTLY